MAFEDELGDADRAYEAFLTSNQIGDFAAIDQILFDHGVQHPRGALGIVGLVGQMDHCAAGRRGDAQAAAYRLGRGGLRLLRPALRRFTQDCGGAQGLDHLLAHGAGTQDGGFGVGDLVALRRLSPFRRAHARLIDIFLADAGEDRSSGGVALLQGHRRRESQPQDHDEDQDHQQQFAKQQADHVQHAVARSCRDVCRGTHRTRRIPRKTCCSHPSPTGVNR